MDTRPDNPGELEQIAADLDSRTVDAAAATEQARSFAAEVRDELRWKRLQDGREAEDADWENPE